MTLGNPSISIGIISKNGEPAITECLKSFSDVIESLSDHFSDVEFILVDSNSSDHTLDIMLDFAGIAGFINVDIRIFSLTGLCNASSARNTILQNCNNRVVFLYDGDIIINLDFIFLAARKITSGQAHAVVGQLSEEWYNDNFEIYKKIETRRLIATEKNVRIAGGIIALSDEVVNSGIHYDEKLRRNEDLDFSLRISKVFKILAVPDYMGTHLTQPYYSKDRFGIFISENFNRPTGVLIRKHIGSISNLFAIVQSEKGVMLGFMYLTLFPPLLILSLKGVHLPFSVLIVLILFDFFLKLRKRRVKRFIVHRFISPFKVAMGLFLNEPDCDYTTSCVKKRMSE